MRESELVTYYLDAFLAMLGTPTGAAALILLLGSIVASATIRNARWVFLTLAIYFATLPLVDVKFKYAALAFPLEQFRGFARPLIYLFTGLLLLPLLTSDRGWRRTVVGWPILLFFIFELTISIRMMAFGNVVRGGLSVISYVLLLLTIGFTLARSLQTYEDFYKFLWCVSAVGGLVTLGTCYQLVVNRAVIINNSRLTGVTSNPQFLGIIIAYTLPFTCYLLTRKGARAWVRPLLIAQVAVTIVLLIWTGSRTGALSTAIGLLVAFHRRIGRFAIAGGIVCMAVLFLMPYFQGSQEIAGRLLSTENTRAGVWANLILNIKEHFWLGAARETFETQESSYLSILGQFGIFGSLPCLAAMCALAVQLIQLQQLRRYLGTEASVVDLMCGVWAAVAVTAAFESLLVGVITFSILLIYAFFVATTFLLDWCRATAQAEQYQYPQDAMLAAA